MNTLKSKVDMLNLDTFPRTLLLNGEKGCGKHTLLKYISSHLALEVEDITDNISLELISDIMLRPNPTIYAIDIDKLTLNEENAILKFLEEPLKNSFIILLSENKYNLIPTIFNRCVIWDFAPYEKEYLRNFLVDKNQDMILEYATTPGKVIEYCNHKIYDMVALANKIFDNISKANIANALSLSKYLSFKSEKDKFDVDIFFDILRKVAEKRYVNNLGIFKHWELTSKLVKKCKIKNVDKKLLFDSYIIEMYMITR